MPQAAPARMLALIAAGGAIGSIGRYAVETLIPFSPSGIETGFPWATFLVNITGALGMGFLVAWLLAHHRAPEWVGPFIGVGVLGGWTTYSTFAAESHALVGAGQGGVSLAYILVSVGVGLLAVAVGVFGGQRIWGRCDA